MGGVGGIRGQEASVPAFESSLDEVLAGMRLRWHCATGKVWECVDTGVTYDLEAGSPAMLKNMLKARWMEQQV